MGDEKIDQGTQKVRSFLSLIAVLLVLVGMIIVYAAPVKWEVVLPPPLWLSIAGLLLFVFATFYRPGRRIRSIFERLPIGGPSAWIIVAVLLTGLAAFTMVQFGKGNRTNYLPVTTFWFGAAFCYLAAFRASMPQVPKLREWLFLHRRELIILGSITLLGAALRLYKLGELPYVINGDEGRMGLAAQSTDYTGLANPFGLWENFGSLYLQGIALAIKLFGPTAFALRLLPALGGILAIPATYLFARELSTHLFPGQISGKRIAVIAVMLLAFSHTHLNFSRTAAVGYIQGTWLVPLELYLFLSGIEKRSSWRAAAGGILLAVHFSIYLTSQIVVGLLLVFILISFIFLRSWIKPALRQIFAFWGGLLVMMVPEVVYVWQQPNMFFERLMANGTFQTNWVAETMASTGKTAVELLGERVLHAFLALIYFPAIDFYGSTIPMLSLLSAALFLVGMAFVLFRKQTPGLLMLNGYFWAFTVSVGLFAIPPSADSYRMLIAFPAALIMTAIGLDQILYVFGLGWRYAPKIYISITGLVLASLMLFNMWTYFDDFTGQCLYGDNTEGRFASYLGSYAQTIERGNRIYLLSDDIFFYGSHASVDYLGQRRTIVNFPEPVGQLTLIPGESVVANPDRIEELEAWALSHPSGKLRFYYDCTNIIMAVYQQP
jgi:4-amino-4-deoxy-L-arabinose transferase-like glycosyltransferase